MARIHTRKKGQSGSKRPSIQRVPEWVSVDPRWVESTVVDLAKSGTPPSMIGLILRDQYGVPLIKTITGKKVTRILEEHSLQTRVPEDLRSLITRAVTIRRHLETNKKDLVAKRRLQLTESKIHRLSRYYVRQGKLPSSWKYSAEQAAVLLR
ncbi:MAG: 30S ribosomal protein S15 [Candidatus Thorarchaeota archaeon]